MIVASIIFGTACILLILFLTLKQYELSVGTRFFFTRALQDTSPSAERIWHKTSQAFSRKVSLLVRSLYRIILVLVSKLLHDTLHIVGKGSVKMATVVHEKKKLITKKSGSLYLRSLNEYKDHEIDKNGSIDEHEVKQ
jgi:hypothetical protein